MIWLLDGLGRVDTGEEGVAYHSVRGNPDWGLVGLAWEKSRLEHLTQFLAPPLNAADSYRLIDCEILSAL